MGSQISKFNILHYIVYELHLSDRSILIDIPDNQQNAKPSSIVKGINYVLVILINSNMILGIMV